MPGLEPARERIARRLQDAVDRLRHDMEQVEFWSEVLGCLTRAAPDYDSDTNVLNRFRLPSQRSDTSERMGQQRMGQLGRFGSDESSEEDETFSPDRPSNTTRSRH